MKRPDEGEASIAPDALYYRQVDGETITYVPVPNWSKSGSLGRNVFCVQFESPEGETSVVLGKPRLEVYESFEQALVGTDMVSQLLLGTESSNNKSLIRGIDMTNEVVNSLSSQWPPSEWWFDASLAEGQADGNRIKYLKGSESFLEPSIGIKPVGGEVILDGDSGEYYTGSDVSSEFYFSVASIIPDDILRGQTNKDLIFIIRTFTP